MTHLTFVYGIKDCGGFGTAPIISVVEPSPTTVEVKASTQPTKVVMKHVKCVLLEKDNYYSWEV